MSRKGVDMELEHAYFMREALKEAESALVRGDRAIGAVVVLNGVIIGRGSSHSFSRRSKLAHAEINALLEAEPLLFDRPHQATLYTTVEPCPLCLGAIVMADLAHLVFGTPDYHAGATCLVDSMPFIRQHIHSVTGGILADECLAMYRRSHSQEADLISSRP